jgi:hypothetical protein
MPKSFKEFSAGDWRHLRPVTQAVKSLRYRMIDKSCRRKPARAGDAAAVARSIRGRKVLVTIAFSDPALISWQARLIRHYVPDAHHVVVDNSPADAVAAQIGRIAGAAAYLRAPENPWSGDAASRSHGVALNWAWDNLIRPGEPFSPLATQDVYGIVRTAGPRRFLWAGFCMYRFAAVKNKRLDFGQDWFVGLDTGGANWKALYSHIDMTALRQPHTTFFPFKPGIAVAEGPLQWCGPWLHEVGLMGDRRLFAEKRSTLAQMLAPHLDEAEALVAIDAA